MTAIDKLRPGIETDILVAEKVMGLKVVPDEVNWRRYSVGEAGIHGEDVPQYSRTIEDAWMVVEKIGNMTLRRSPRREILGITYPLEYRAVFYDEDRETGMGCADSGPMAICLAALDRAGALA